MFSNILRAMGIEMGKKPRAAEGIHLLAEKTSLPTQLLWLADAPLFIDADRVNNFYDAVVRPYMRPRTIVSEQSNKKAIDVKTEFGLSGEVDSGQLIKALSGWLPQLKLSTDGKLSGGGNYETSSKVARTWEVIETPQRQLEQLCLHYVVFQRERLCVSTTPFDEADWKQQEWISKVPRGLVLLDLPAGTKMLPTFAEFADEGPQKLLTDAPLVNGELSSKAPQETDWNAVFNRFDAQQCIEGIEGAGKSRIDSIDYRVRLPGTSGETLHLHLEPKGGFPTLTFAYSMVKRTEKHGLRLVGTMRSGPSMCVLAAYEC